jgi:diguanylate cyclase (GGDEF)-like protein
MRLRGDRSRVLSTPRTLLDNAADKLPSPNGVASAIMELWEDDNTTVQQLAHLVQADPALTGRLLKLANSAAFASRPVTSISEAIIKLGMKTVGQLAVAFSLIDKDFDAHCKSFDYPRFWSHSLFMALVCRGIGRLTGVAPPDDLFSCALMARIGLLAFATVYPDEYSDLLDANPDDQTEAERRKFGFDHNELSAEMLADFGVPEVLAEPARFHEKPETSGFAKGSRSLRLTDAFCLGYRIADLFMGSGTERTRKTIKTLAQVKRLGLAPEPVIEVFDQSVTEWEEWSQIFDLPTPSVRQQKGFTRKDADETAATEAERGMRALLVSGAGEHHPLAGLLPDAGVQTHTFESHREMLKFALQIRPQLIVVDATEQEDKRDKLFRLIRSTEWGKSVYIITVLDEADSDNITRAFQAGIDAHIHRDIGADELESRLQAVRRLFDLQLTWQKDRAELRRIANELALSQRRTEVLSLTDQLTNLPNRRSALAAMQQAWRTSNRADMPMSVVMIDIDLFKNVNDTHGHAAGDKVLVDVAKVLRDDIRDGDSVFRMGGEEFLLLSSTSDLKQLVVAAERLRRRIETLTIEFEEKHIRVTISLGMAQREADQKDFDELLVAADQALYAAKSEGRNCICYYRRERVQKLNVPRQG